MSLFSLLKCCTVCILFLEMLWDRTMPTWGAQLSHLTQALGCDVGLLRKDSWNTLRCCDDPSNDQSSVINTAVQSRCAGQTADSHRALQSRMTRDAVPLLEGHKLENAPSVQLWHFQCNVKGFHSGPQTAEIMENGAEDTEETTSYNAIVHGEASELPSTESDTLVVVKLNKRSQACNGRMDPGIPCMFPPAACVPSRGSGYSWGGSGGLTGGSRAAEWWDCWYSVCASI